MKTAAGSLIATYKYDALNRRVEKIVEEGYPASDRITRFLYDGWRAVEERAVITTPTAKELVRARYGFGNGLDEVLWMDRDQDASNDIESRHFVHQDMLGSAVAVTSSQRSSNSLVVAERFTYAAYGEPRSWAGEWAGGAYPGIAQPESRVKLPYTYTGQRFDAESGYYYYKNRYYSAVEGRFLRRDPIGLAGGINEYSYADSTAHSSIDPFGLTSNSARRNGIASWARKRNRQVAASRVRANEGDGAPKGGPPGDDRRVDNRCKNGVSAAYRNCADYQGYLKEKSEAQGTTYWTVDEISDAEAGGYDVHPIYGWRSRVRKLTDKEMRNLGAKKNDDGQWVKETADGGSMPVADVVQEEVHEIVGVEVTGAGLLTPQVLSDGLGLLASYRNDKLRGSPREYGGWIRCSAAGSCRIDTKDWISVGEHKMRPREGSVKPPDARGVFHIHGSNADPSTSSDDALFATRLGVPVFAASAEGIVMQPPAVPGGPPATAVQVMGPEWIK